MALGLCLSPDSFPGPAPGVIPPPPSSSSPLSAMTRGPLVAVLGVRAVPAEVPPIPALVAPHARVEPPPAPSSGPWPGIGHPDPSPADIQPVRFARRLHGVLFVAEDHEREAGHASRHPDLLERTELSENLLEVAFAGVGIEIGNVKTAFVVGTF